jgi:two-component sensor histidine kinase
VRKLVTGRAADIAAGAALVVTELATNALIHGELPGQARLEITPDGRLRIEVDDLCPTRPRPASRPSQRGGMGTRVVDRVALSWGSTPRPGAGKTVWAELTLTPTNDPDTTPPATPVNTTSD